MLYLHMLRNIVFEATYQLPLTVSPEQQLVCEAVKDMLHDEVLKWTDLGHDRLLQNRCRLQQFLLFAQVVPQLKKALQLQNGPSSLSAVPFCRYDK